MHDIDYSEYGLGDECKSYSPLPYQQKSIDRLYDILLREGRAADTSSTGVGKTFIAAFACARLNIPVLVVCPRAVKSAWEDAMIGCGVKCFRCITYNALVLGNSGFGKIVKRGSVKYFNWYLAPNSLIIYDEAHRLCDYKSSAAVSAWCAHEAIDELGNYKYRILLLSATLAKDPLGMRAIGSIMGITTWKNWWAWTSTVGCVQGAYGQRVYMGGPSILKDIYLQMKDRTTKLSNTDPEVSSFFGENSVTVQRVPTDPAVLKSNKPLYDTYKKVLELRKEAEYDDKSSNAVVAMRRTQELELLKIPYLVDRIPDLLEEGNSVAIFLRYTDSVYALYESLKANGIESGIFDGKVDGKDGFDEREISQKKFQDGRLRVIIVQASAGGVGLSLHDTTGEHPRIAFITPVQSSILFFQILGRVHRAGQKSPAKQYVLASEGTVEDRILGRIGANALNQTALMGEALDQLNIEISTFKKRR